MTVLAERAPIPAGRAARRWLSPRLAPGSWLALALLGVLGLLVVAPITAVLVVAASGQGGLELAYLRDVLASTRVIGNTLFVALGSTLVAVTLGGALAFVLVRTNVPGRRVLERLVVVPLYITGLLTAIGWAWLGSPRAGIVNLLWRRLTGAAEPLVNLQSPGGIVFVAAMSAVPLAFLMISGALRSMDPALEESARIGGATLIGAWRRVTLPLVLPAVAGSALLVFVNGMGLFAIPAVLGLPVDYAVIGTEIYTLLTNYPPRIGRAAAWGLVLLVATALLVGLQALVLGRRSFVTVTGKAFRPRPVALGPVRYLLAAAAWTYLALAVLLPVLALVWAATLEFVTVDPRLMRFGLGHFHYVLFTAPKTALAATNSVLLGALSAGAVCALGLLVGWVLVRSRSRLRTLLDVLGMAPLAVPSLTFALGVLWFYVTFRVIPLYGTIGVLFVAYVAHFLPYGIRAASGGFRQLHPELEEAARVAGAGFWTTLRLITAPLMRPTIAAAFLLVFVMALQEVSASILLYTNRSVVLSVVVYGLWEQGNISALAALSVLQLAAMLVLVGVLGAVRREEPA